MKNKYFKILIFLSFAIMFSYPKVVAQRTQKENFVTIESVVKDEKGNPIKGATIFGKEGLIVVKTDASGKFTISVPDYTGLFIESDGYESKLFKAEELITLKEFQLKTSEFLYSEKDNINVAFGKEKRGDIVGSVSVIEPDEIVKYDNTQSLSDAMTGRILGLLGSSNIRGLGNALFVVDGLPRDISSLNMSEVDQITVLKDINSSILYGSAAVNGVVLITTKRGQAHKQMVNVTGYYGISTPTQLPKYLSSADFMQLNNEARMNDGLLPQYDATTISNYTTGNKYRYPSINYYSNEYLKSFKPFFKATTELSGGNDIATYYSYLGWDQTGSLLNFGAGDAGKQNKFNVRGNVDLKINSFIKSSIDAVAVFNNTKGPVGTSYWTSASTLKPNLFAPLLPMSLIDPNNALLKNRKNDLNGLYLLGGTSSYLTNPIADGYSGGNNENIQRTFSFNNRIDFDLNQFVKGLAFHTNFSFDLYTRYDQAVLNTYSVYLPTWKVAVDSIASLTQYGSDTRPGTQSVANSYYERRFGFYGLLDYDRTFGDVHHFSGSLVGFGNRYKIQGDYQGQKNVNMGLRLAYTYNKKYLVDFSSALVNSVKLPKGNKVAFSPSLGLAWVISSEDFMSSAKFIDYLKLRVSGGIINSDAAIGGFYYYDNLWTTSSSYNWFDGTWSTSGAISNYAGNQQLAIEKRKELNFGFEGLLFNHLLQIDANVFTSQYTGQITKPQTLYPSFYTNFIPYMNFGKTGYSGAELGLSVNKSMGDLSVVVGANILYANSNVIKRDEIYGYAYQYRTGRPVDALFGLVAEGFFADATDIANHAQQTFGIVKPGDIKYVDQNNDGIIDANDQIQIGRSQSPFSYGLNLKLTYKSLTLFVMGDGRMGADSYITGDYYWVDGNKKYSQYILNRWTASTSTTATYPRLSSQTNLNNFQNSTFWLYRNNYFRFNRVQLNYEMPETVAKIFLMHNLSFYLAASNLLTLSKHREIRELNIGSEPQYRSYSIGIKTMF